jgi:hypothetical protein
MKTARSSPNGLSFPDQRRNSDGRQPIHLQKVFENVKALSKPTALAMTSTLSSVIDNKCRAR